MSTATTHIDNKPSLRGTKQSHPLAPALRFKEFDGEWRETTLGNLFTFKNGLNSDKEKYGSGRKFINVLDIIGNNVITYDSIIGKVEVTEKELEKNEVIYGDVLFQRSSETREEVGQANIYVDENKSAVFGGFVIRGRKKEDYNPYFMNYLLKTSPARKEITTKSGGSTRYNVGQASLSEVIVNLTGVPEQQKIASFLAAVDEKIQQLTKKKALLADYKKGVMQQLFSGQLRFKYENGKDYPDWEEKRLSKFLKYYDGTHQTPKYVEKGVPFYSVEHITRNQFSKTKFITEEVFEKENKRVMLEKGDILMTRIGDIGTARLIDWDVRASFYVSLALLKQNPSFDSTYLNQYISSVPFQKELWAKTIHVAFPKKINLGEIGNCKAQLPCIEEQQKIATYLSGIDTKIEAVTNQITQTQTFKKGLLQQLFV
jgi:type I restriction enzyme S subunit